jgi:hypothetical protein
MTFEFKCILGLTWNHTRIKIFLKLQQANNLTRDSADRSARLSLMQRRQAAAYTGQAKPCGRLAYSTDNSGSMECHQIRDRISHPREPTRLFFRHIMYSFKENIPRIVQICFFRLQGWSPSFLHPTWRLLLLATSKP